MPTIENVSIGSNIVQDGITISHTTSGSNRLMLVCIGYVNDDFQTVTSVTYNGTALASQVQINEFDDGYVEIFSLIEPDTGTHDVVVTLSSALITSDGLIVGVVTLTDAHQSTPITATAANNETTEGQVNPALVTISSATAELVIGICVVEDEGNIAADSGQTSLFERTTGHSTLDGSAKDGNTSVTLSWDFAIGDHWAAAAVSIAPAPAATSGSHYYMNLIGQL